MTLKRSILIEGPDGSGKSELFNKLTDSWGLPSAGHDGGPLRDAGEAWKRMAMFAACSPAVRDRCPAISELVYSEALGREPVMDLEEALEWLEKFNPFIIMCRPPQSVIMAQPVQEKAHKSAALVLDIMEMRGDVINMYDALTIRIMRRKKLKIYLYDWTTDKEGDFVWQALIEEGVCADSL